MAKLKLRAVPGATRATGETAAAGSEVRALTTFDFVRKMLNRLSIDELGRLRMIIDTMVEKRLKAEFRQRSQRGIK